MRHVVFGTAGHIDHGKTSLVRALTGVDCDRLPEEQQRGITIDLGFASLEVADLRLHFVDVPGHERLVHTMIAGAAGIDLALLVVAADEGIMPQTREHLEIIRLMDVKGGAVALTKIDLVESELAELAAEEIRDLLAGTAFADVPVVPVSATSGDGVDRLRQVLFDQAAGIRPRQLDGRPFREPIDRVFTLAGAGTVVTGTSLWGRLGVGAEVVLQPSNRRVRARRLHVHGVERSEVEAGERVAINLAGLSHRDIERGEQILEPGPWEPTSLVTIDLELLGSASHALDEGDELEVHALASRVAGRVDRLSRRPLAPGARATAQLSLGHPMLLFPGDRVVLRRPSPINTFAGGRVLDTRLPRWRRRDSARLADLPPVHREAWPELLRGWIESAQLAAPSVDDLAGRLGVLPAALEAPLGRLLGTGGITVLSTQPRRFVATAALDSLATKARDELRRRFEGAVVSSGIPARDFSSSLVPASAAELAGLFLEELRARGAIDLVDGRVLPVGESSFMTSEGEELTRRLDTLYREAGLDPPAPSNAAATLQARPATVEGICRFLVQQNRLVRLDGKYLIHRSVLDDIARRIGAWQVERFSVGEFKEELGLTRKLAIPILEWLDAQRVTVRDGNQRRILRRPAGDQPAGS